VHTRFALAVTLVFEGGARDGEGNEKNGGSRSSGDRDEAIIAQRIAARTRKEGEHKTAIPGLILYHRTAADSLLSSIL